MQAEFVEKNKFLIAMKGKVFGHHLPKFDLCYQKPGLFAVRMLSLVKAGEKELEVVENIVAVKGKKIVWVSKQKDQKFSTALEQNLSFVSNPQDFALNIVEDYSDTILDFLAEVENNFSIVENLILKGKTKRVMEKIFYLKKKLMRISLSNRKYLRLVSFFSRQSKQAYTKSIALYEKLLHIDELIGNYNDLLSNLIDAHMSVISNNLNQVMKVLTIIATIAMPLTVISSIYGMNVNLPLQNSQTAFASILLLMLALTAVMLFVFSKFGWFSEKN